MSTVRKGRRNAPLYFLVIKDGVLYYLWCVKLAGDRRAHVHLDAPKHFQHHVHLTHERIRILEFRHHCGGIRVSRGLSISSGYQSVLTGDQIDSPLRTLQCFGMKAHELTDIGIQISSSIPCSFGSRILLNLRKQLRRTDQMGTDTAPTLPAMDFDAGREETEAHSLGAVSAVHPGFVHESLSSP